MDQKKKLNTFLQRGYTNSHQAHKKMHNIINHPGNTTKIKMGYHLTPSRRALMKQTDNNKCWQECIETGNHIHCWWKQNGATTGVTVWQVLKRVNRVTMPASIPTPRYIIKRKKNTCSHKNTHMDLQNSMIHTCPKAEITQMSID